MLLNDYKSSNVSNLEFDLSRTLKVKYDLIGLPIYDFLLMFNY